MPQGHLPDRCQHDEQQRGQYYTKGHLKQGSGLDDHGSQLDEGEEDFTNGEKQTDASRANDNQCYKIQ